MPDRRLKVGVLGLEGDSTGILGAMTSDARFVLAAAAEVHSETGTQLRERFQLHVCDSIEELCEADVDVVSLGTANRYRFQHAQQVIQAGKHVIFDKLIACSLHEAQQILSAAEQAGVVLAVCEPLGSAAFVTELRRLVTGGELGRLRMISSWVFNDWLYRPRSEEELSPDMPEGLVFRQAPHQIDAIRVIGGGLLRSVRASTGVWDSSRPVAGAYSAFLEFADGVVATAVSSSYDHFHTSDFALAHHGADRAQRPQAQARLSLEAHGPTPEAVLKSLPRIAVGGSQARRGSPLDHMVVSFEQGDVIPSAEGLIVYGDRGTRTIPSPPRLDGPADVINQMYEAIVDGRRPVFDGYWGLGTLEACLALIESSERQAEVHLVHQQALAARPEVAAP